MAKPQQKRGEKKYSIYRYNAYSYNIVNKRYDSETSTIYRESALNTIENGSVISTIKSFIEVPPIWYDYDFNPQEGTISNASMTTEADAESTMLSSKVIKDSENNVLVNETYETDILSGGQICNGLFPYRLLIHEGGSTPNPKFYGAIYWNSNEWASYTGITKTEKFSTGKEISQTKTFGYNTNLKLKIEETIEYDAVADKVVTRYSGEYHSLTGLPAIYTGSTEALALVRGLKKHMINLPVEKLAYKNDKILGGSLVLYQSTGSLFAGYKIFPYKEYRLVTDSPIEESNFTFSELDRTSFWGVYDYSFNKDTRYELVRTYNKFDSYGNILQYHNQYGTYNSFIWGCEGLFPIAEVINAKYNEIFHTSFEEDPGIYAWHDYSFASDKTHSGDSSLKSVKASSGEYYYYMPMLNIDNSATKTYKYSAWVYSTATSADLFCFHQNINDSYLGTNWVGESQRTYEKDKWVLLEGEISVPSDKKCIYLRVDNNGSGTVWFDDLRLYPTDAQMTTSTYDPTKGVTSKSDVTGRVSSYEYDNFRRLKLIKDDDGNILESYSYHYKGEPVDEIIPDDLEVSTTGLRFFDVGGTLTFTITSIVDWTITTDVGWLIINPVSGSNNATIEVSCSYEDNGIGTITVTGGGITKTISVRQLQLIPIP